MDEDPDGNVYATITEKTYFLKEGGCVSDWHIFASNGGALPDIPGWFEEAEGFLMPDDPSTTKEDARKDLESHGLEHCPDLAIE